MTTAPQNENEPERRRISIPSISATALRWYLSVFNLLTAYLAVTNTIFAVQRENAAGWQAIQYIATGELLKAGGVALIVSPILAEGLKMVLAEILSERRIRKASSEAEARGLAKGWEEGKNIQQSRWEDWWQRYQNAQAAGIPFDEPPPQPDDQTESQR